MTCILLDVVHTSGPAGIIGRPTPSGEVHSYEFGLREGVCRLLRMSTLMQQGEAGNASDLSERLQVAERTVYRDLPLLTDLGVPCYFDEEEGRYRVRKDFFLPPVQLSAAETLALLSVAQGVGGQEELALTTAASRAAEKIKAQLPANVVEELGDVTQHIDMPFPASGPASEAIRDVFGLIQQASVHHVLVPEPLQNPHSEVRIVSCGRMAVAASDAQGFIGNADDAAAAETKQRSCCGLLDLGERPCWSLQPCVAPAKLNDRSVVQEVAHLCAEFGYVACWLWKSTAGGDTAGHLHITRL